MWIFELADLPESLWAQVAALNFLDEDPPFDARFMLQLRERGYPISEYQGLFAVESDQLLGKLDTTVHPYVTPAGREEALWISGVETRPDSLRRGIARALLTEVHRRERGTGRRWTFLWIHRSWGAHQLYENLGYRDVYSPPAAIRRLGRAPRRALPKGYALIVVSGRCHATAMLDGLEQAMAGRWLGIRRTTFITDNLGLLQRRGYAVFLQSHPAIMAKPLRGDSRTPPSAAPVRVCGSPAFSFHDGDAF